MKSALPEERQRNCYFAATQKMSVRLKICISFTSQWKDKLR